MMLHYILFFIGAPVGAVLFPVAERLERRYKGKSDAVRGILLGLPIAVFAVGVMTLSMLGVF